MREVEEEVDNKENDANQNPEENNDMIKNPHKQTRLQSIDSLIEVKDENRLQSIDSFLRAGTYDEFDSFNGTEEEENEGDPTIPKIIYFIKNNAFVFALLMAPSLNYSFLYLPLIVLGFILSFFLSSNSKNIYLFKKTSEIFALVYSALLLIFKIVLIVLTKNDNSWVRKKENIFLNLGIKILKDKDSKTYLVSTFIGEAVLFLISLVSMIISIVLIDNDLDEEVNKKTTKKEMFHLLMYHLFINYFLLIGLAIFNTSIITLLYLFPINILIFFMAKHSNIKKIALSFKLIAIIIHILFILQIFCINLLNTYHFEDSLTSKETTNQDGDKKFYSAFTQFGINYLYGKDKLGEMIRHWIGYFFAVITFLSFCASNNKITFDKIFSINENINESKSQENLYEKKEEEEEENFFVRILVLIKDYLKSPYFILHICRAFAIGYLYIFRNFFAIIVFIWLLFSFLFLRVSSNKKLTFVLVGTLSISLICFHIGNIDGFYEHDEKAFSVFDSYHFNLYKKNNKLTFSVYYLCHNLFYFFIILFIYSLYDITEKPIWKEGIIPSLQKKEIKDESLQKIDLEENLLEKKDKESINSTNDKIEEDNLISISGNNDRDNLDENKISESGVKQQIISKEKKDESRNIKKIVVNEEFLNKLTILNIFKKAFFAHIDLISLVVMYFVAINSINIIHSILVIIFMIQLLFPRLIEATSKYLIIITQSLYFVELIVDIFKKYYLDDFNKKENLVKLYLPYDTDKSKTSVEIFIYGIVYCFYIQYTLYNNDFYKEVVIDEEINLSNYVEYKLAIYPTLKKILFLIGRIIIEIYIWILISLFIYFDSYFEISILFEIKLIIFFVIVFQFLISIQKSKKQHISLILNWIFLIYCSLNTILVYGYQIICLEYFDIKESKKFLRQNLPNIGFSEYPDDLLYLKLLPHFMCNFISILYIWEIKRILLKSNNIDKNNIENKIDIENKLEIIDDKEKSIKEKENKSEDGDENKEDGSENEDISATDQYEKNKLEMKYLNLQYYLFNIILIITKFYWLFLFLSIGIIFTSYDLSIILSLYILLFGITFIAMFYEIITKLNKFVMSRKSFFISRLLRYNLIEQNKHVMLNKYYRSLAFKYLLCFSFFSYLLFYTYGVFYLFQKGCNPDEWKGCDDRFSPIVKNEDKELYIQSLAYLIGFFVNTRIDSVFKEGWYHLFFSLLISFDVYVQKLENYFNDLVEKNRKRHIHLANENIKLKPLTFGEDNILMNITYGIKKVEEKMEKEKSVNNLLRSASKSVEQEEPIDLTKGKSKSTRLRAKRPNKAQQIKEIINEKEEKGLKLSLLPKNQAEDEIVGKKLIKDFLKIFDRAGSKDVKLSNKNYKYQIIKVLKKIFEEIIIFLLICTSISKMNFYSLIYMVISIIFIMTEKRMIKFYILYCFMILSTVVQSIIFVSNIQESTDPYPDEDILREMNDRFNIPWYRKKIKKDDKLGFFYGLGVSHSQINLIWLEFMEIVIIYVYLDYFSYSIYQEENTIGRTKDKVNKINYYNLFLNKETNVIARKLPKDEYEKHKLCMKENFGVDILPYEEFIFYMWKGMIKSNYDEKKDQQKALPSIPEEAGEDKENSIINNDTNEGVLTTDRNENDKDNEGDILSRIKTIEEVNIDDEKNRLESPLMQKLGKRKKMATSTNLLEKSKTKVKAEGSYFTFLKHFVYLSLHNVILIIIIIISMMISSFFSIFYITYSLYFLITSTSIYLGNKYKYPRAIKTILRVTILIDITIQILYQSPYINSDTKDESDEIDFAKILEFIGLNKILTFKKMEKKEGIDDDYDKMYKVVLDYDQLVLVLAKAFTYLFMSFQILVYSSQSFQEYYLSYIITKNNKLRRITLMNVFKFNNNRIEAMNKSINLRQDMSQSMTVLKNKLEQWNANLMMTKSDKAKIKTKVKKEKEKEEVKKEEDNINNEIGLNFINNIKKLGESKKEEDDKDKEQIQEEPKKEEEEKEEVKKEEEEKEDENKPIGLLGRMKRIKRKRQEQKEEEQKRIEELQKKEEEEKKEDEEKKKEEEEEKKKQEEENKKQEEENKKNDFFKPGGFLINLGLPINPIIRRENAKEEEPKEEKKEKVYLPEKEVFQKIKDWILGGFLIRLQIWIHKYASNYTTIENDEIVMYEKDTIQGKTKITSFIENMVEAQLKTIDLSSFTREEMKEVKTFFDGTRAKKLEELKKEREKKKKFQSAGNKIIFINKLKEQMENNKKLNEDGESKLISNRLTSDDNKKEDKKLDGFKGVLEEVKKQQKKEKETMIDLNEPKFKKLEKFISGKLFVKYLTKTYIIKSILIDILSFCLNNFHWPCYLIMILNHMMVSTFLTLYYPLSIFCYAILEYPRPKKSYWTFTLIYTVILLGGKFVIHLGVFKYVKVKGESLAEHLRILDHYKLGFKIYDSSFSTDFFEYIFYDALVLIFLLINNYLLVSRGIWTQRESDVETIYQAMERIAKTKDIEFNDLMEVESFNNSHLESYQKKKMTKEDRKTFRFSNILQTDDLLEEKKSLSKSTRHSRIKALNLKKSVGESKSNELSKEKTFYENKTVIKRSKKHKLLKNLEEEEKKEEERRKEEDKKYDESKRKYYEKLFPKIRNEKPGDEYYASYTISMLLIIIFVLIFYTTMVQDKNFGSVELDTKQFSGSMVIVLLFHVAILVYDRILYISQNRNNLKYDYILYDKKTKIPLNEKQFNDIKSDISSEYPDIKRDTFLIPFEYIDKLKKKYNIVFIQTEELNLPLVQKYILHIVIVLLSHAFIFFYAPMTGNLNIYNNIYCQTDDEDIIEDEEGNSCNDFVYNKALIIFYLLYLVYLFSSGLQIKYGYYDMKRKSMLKSGNSSYNGTIYNTFKAIPFIYEIKLGIDWTFTKTCLDLFQWNKFESVYDIVYCTYCAMTAKNQQLVGQKIGKLLKIGMGGTLSFVLIFILVAPLMLFSSLNPTNQMNNLTGATLKVDLSFFYKNGAIKNYTLYENSKPESIESIFRQGNDWRIYNYSESPKSKNFPKSQIQTVQFFNESDKNWDLARPHIENLRELILNRGNDTDLEYIGLVIDYNFDRPLPAESMKISKRYSSTIYYYDNATEDQNVKLNKIGEALLNCKDEQVVYENIYSPPIRLSANIKPKRLLDPRYFPNLDVALGFKGCRNNTNSNGTPSYLESYFTFQKKAMNKNGKEIEGEFEGIKFHVFSDQVSTTTSGKNILTFYVSFVLLVGTYVRNFFAGQPEKIMLTEMPHSEEIINLCEGIKVSRNSFDFEQEEKLYYILIEIMRSPDYLRALTQSSTEQFRQRQELTRASKTSDDI